MSISKEICHICKKEIKELLYWADPKFYKIPKKLYLCGSICSTKLYEDIKHIFKE